MGRHSGGGAAARIELSSIDLRVVADIERTIETVARVPNGGLIMAVSALGQIHRELVAKLAAERRLPVVYPYRFFVADGGLVSYGPDLTANTAAPPAMSTAS